MPRVHQHPKRTIIAYLLLITATLGVLAYVAWLHITSQYTMELPFSQPEELSTQEEISAEPEEDAFLRIEPVEFEGLDPSKPMVALSFDDAVTGITGDYLAILEEYGCEATFFVVGYLAEKQPDIFRLLADSGMELGNHSYSHEQLVGLSVERAAEQFDACSALMTGLAGEEAAPVLARPPYDRVDGRVLEASAVPVVLYSLDARDADAETAEEICGRVMGSVTDGDIIRLHDGCTQTVEALPSLLEALREAGYQVTTVGKLFASHGYGLKSGFRYTRLPEEKGP
ncbi:MAG TPA: polysaccharide deacetylase family protein [Candidatus Merdivicinus intestinavium]|nr:polysaccharide deacetylase family protein [Candidatus Merdivicinus intestinavium]